MVAAVIHLPDRVLFAPALNDDPIERHHRAGSIGAEMTVNHDRTVFRIRKDSKRFEHPIVRFYGRISYSFYLINPLTLFAFWHMPEALGQIMQLPVPGILVALTMFLISVAVTTPIAWLMYKYVERPGVALGRRLVAVQFKEWLPLRPAPADLASPHA